MAGIAIKALAVAALVCLVFDNASTGVTAYTEDEDDGESKPPPPPTTKRLTDRMSGAMNGVGQGAVEALDGAGSAVAAPVLGRAGPSPGARNTENRLAGDDTLGRLQQTKGRALAAAKKAVDETVHKLTSTVDGIRRTVSGDDGDDEGGDRRVSDALDSLLRAVGAEGRAAFDYASDVINETADRAKAAVERARLQQQQRGRPLPSRDRTAETARIL